MKQCYTNLLLGAAVLISSITFAQEGSNSGPEKSIRINLYGAYAFEDSFESYYSGPNYFRGEKQDCFQYGGSLELDIANQVAVELLYLRENTTAPITNYPYDGKQEFANYNVDMNYIMLGGMRKFRKPDSKVEAFLGFMAGVNLLYVDTTETTPDYSNNDVKFAWGLKGGATVWATEKVGIKFMAQMLSTAQAMGAGLTFGTGGAGVAIGSSSSIYTFSLGGGLVYNLSK